jgi:arginine exporter protein ArgO
MLFAPVHLSNPVDARILYFGVLALGYLGIALAKATTATKANHKTNHKKKKKRNKTTTKTIKKTSLRAGWYAR